MPLVDTHCHLQHAAFDQDREGTIDAALSVLDWIVVIGDDVASSREAVALSRPRVYATAGIHPHHAINATPEALGAIRTLAGERSVVALGEIGLDYYYDFSPREAQRTAFQQQLAIAAETGLPVVIHCRDAYEDVSASVQPVHRDLAGGVMHCFSGNPGFAEQCLSWGFYISFAGNVTFPKAVPLREAAKIVPLDRLLVETDSPYLAPQPVRGKRCEPTHVVHTAKTLAEIKGVSLEDLAAATTRNASRLFRRTEPPSSS